MKELITVYQRAYNYALRCEDVDKLYNYLQKRYLQYGICFYASIKNIKVNLPLKLNTTHICSTPDGLYNRATLTDAQKLLLIRSSLLKRLNFLSV